MFWYEDICIYICVDDEQYMGMYMSSRASIFLVYVSSRGVTTQICVFMRGYNHVIEDAGYVGVDQSQREKRMKEHQSSEVKHGKVS